MGLLAAPALMNKGYQKELTSGIICASGTLGILIPPSIMMVVYAGLTGMKETSVGNLFAGAIFPGLILSSLYLIYIYILCSVKPELGPPIPEEEAAKYSARQKWSMTLKSLVPPLALILMVMGTILAGIATPTEAAAMGALGAFILALFNKAITWKVMRDASVSTLKTTSMVMVLFMAGTFFSTVFLSNGGGDVVQNLFIGSGMNKWLAIFIMQLIIFILGMFIDWTAILLVTVPIFLPIAVQLGFSPLWFAILMCVNLQTSFLTPPFGYALFYFKGVAPKGYTMMHVYKGILPFVLLQIIGMVLVCVFPELATYLPHFFFGK
jgi:tripartite ATP-independent transporter DctM subunit